MQQILGGRYDSAGTAGVLPSGFAETMPSHYAVLHYTDVLREPEGPLREILMTSVVPPVGVGTGDHEAMVELKAALAGLKDGLNKPATGGGAPADAPKPAVWPNQTETVGWRRSGPATPRAGRSRAKRLVSRRAGHAERQLAE
jgi:hypothetical protein